MKAEFQILKSRPKIQITLSRDSVCAGDDSESHDKTIEAYSFVDPEPFARQNASGYLPSVAGHNHSWTCKLNGTSIAEIRDTGIKALIRETPFSSENHVHFDYHAARG